MPETVDASLVDPVEPGDLVLVHAGVALDRALGIDPAMSAEPTGFLYPFIEAEERDAGLLSPTWPPPPQDKIADSRALRRSLSAAQDVLAQAATAMADRFGHGGQLFAFGNGGSATDAEGTVAPVPPPPYGRALPALSLVDDRAVLTALANDVGFDLVFSRQIIAHAQPGDIAVGFSTSGDSVNMLAPSKRRRAGASSPSGCAVRRGGHGARAMPSTTAWSCVRQRPSDPGDPGRPDARAVVDRPAASREGAPT